MADLPQLPERVRRKLALQWDALVETHGFTGDHLKWIETRRRKIVTGASRPPADIHSLTVRYIQDRTGPSAPVYAPADTIGVGESGLLAVERFAQLTWEYFAVWTAGPAPRSDVFTAWLVQLRAVVADEVAELWKERGDWFQRVCRVSLDEGLTPMFDQMKRSAREIEIADLAPENIPFEKVMEQAREAIEGADKLLAEGAKLRSEEPPNALTAPNEAASDGREATTLPGTSKVRRQFREPRPELLAGLESVGKQKAALALGTTTRTIDRWVGTEKLAPIGGGGRTRFRTKDLLKFLNEKKLRQVRQNKTN